MHEATAAGGEWILTWLSPVAYLVLDIVFIVLVFAAIDLLLKAFQWVRHRG
jgi:flagellar biosynthesis protein FlhB